MRTGVAIDAACDLPQAFIEQHHIAVMPIVVKVGEGALTIGFAAEEHVAGS